MRRVAIIGAGAAGCFCAALLREWRPDLAVTLFEAGARPMAKLAITGGGRCNLTNDFQGIRSLSEAYPRGERVMKRALKAFSQDDTIRWFTERGVPCVLQEDHCWFPQSQNALDIVHALLRAMKGADVRLKTPVISVAQPVVGNYFSQDFAKNQFSTTSTKPAHKKGRDPKNQFSTTSTSPAHLNMEVMPVGRTEIGLEARRCLLCGNEVRYCMRAKSHTVSELLARIEEMVKECSDC
jgi:choline dehydrogenase-like flavoprotein